MKNSSQASLLSYFIFHWQMSFWMEWIGRSSFGNHCSNSQVFCQFVFFALERLENFSSRHEWCFPPLFFSYKKNRMMGSNFFWAAVPKRRKGRDLYASGWFLELLCLRARTSRFLTHWGRKNDRCYCRSKVKALGYKRAHINICYTSFIIQDFFKFVTKLYFLKKLNAYCLGEDLYS